VQYDCFTYYYLGDGRLMCTPTDSHDSVSVYRSGAQFILVRTSNLQKKLGAKQTYENAKKKFDLQKVVRKTYVIFIT